MKTILSTIILSATILNLHADKNTPDQDLACTITQELFKVSKTIRDISLNNKVKAEEKQLATEGLQCIKHVANGKGLVLTPRKCLAVRTYCQPKKVGRYNEIMTTCIEILTQCRGK